MLFENVAGKRYRDARCRFLAARALCTTVPHHLDLGSHACFYVGARSSRSRGLVSPQRELRCASIAPGGFLAPHRDPDAASINERFGSISAIPAAAFVQREAALQGSFRDASTWLSSPSIRGVTHRSPDFLPRGKPGNQSSFLGPLYLLQPPLPPLDQRGQNACLALGRHCAGAHTAV